MADLRLAELLAALSQVTDLGMGLPPETAIRCCLLATGLARRMEIDEAEIGAIYYTTLLQHIGCNAYAHETAAVVGGDDIAFRAAGCTVDAGNPREMLSFLLLGIGKGAPPATRIRAVVNTMRAGPSFFRRFFQSNCEVAIRTADRVGLSPGVQRGLDTIYERWDGKGEPHGIDREGISLAARFAQVAGQGELFHRLGGPEAAIKSIRTRAGAAFDPAIADAFVHLGLDLIAEIDTVDPAVAVLDAEPDPRRRIPDTQVDELARAFADVGDLKSPFMHGHSTAVSRLAEATARDLGLAESDITAVRRAGLLHELGRAGIPNGIWDKADPLTTTEWEQVRLHPYYGERILSQSSVLAPLAPLAGMHHEREDGSGYHRQLTGSMTPTAARILATANAYQALIEDRPYRPGHAPDAAAQLITAGAEAGRLDPEIVRAVLTVAGHPPFPGHHAWPAGLTDREVEVLRLAARGLSNKEIGKRLFISPKTADHHVQHIYAKIGVSTRAGAAIFAMQHDLVQPHPA